MLNLTRSIYSVPLRVLYKINSSFFFIYIKTRQRPSQFSRPISHPLINNRGYFTTGFFAPIIRRPRRKYNLIK